MRKTVKERNEGRREGKDGKCGDIEKEGGMEEGKKQRLERRKGIHFGKERRGGGRKERGREVREII